MQVVHPQSHLLNNVQQLCVIKLDLANVDVVVDAALLSVFRDHRVFVELYGHAHVEDDVWVSEVVEHLYLFEEIVE
jgi:hypothetical protein